VLHLADRMYRAKEQALKKLITAQLAAAAANSPNGALTAGVSPQKERRKSKRRDPGTGHSSRSSSGGFRYIAEQDL
jgi:hypothetical protein